MGKEGEGGEGREREEGEGGQTRGDRIIIFMHCIATELKES